LLPLVNQRPGSGTLPANLTDSGKHSARKLSHGVALSEGTDMRRFWTDREGNIALVFALAAVPIFGAMSAAVDYSMASAYRADIQKALDATALALTKIMPTDEATLNTVGNQYFQANLKSHNLSNLQLTIQPDIGQLRLTASGTYNVQMAHIIGADTIDLSASAEAKWSIGKVEIALALDNSWSMNSLGRMTQLKAAAHNLLNVLEGAAKQPDDAKVAIVPFDAVVNVGTANSAAAWLRWGVCSGSNCGPNNSTNWQGCVWDRDKNNDASDVEPAASNATKYPAWQCNNSLNSNRLVSMMPLTTNWTSLHTKVDDMIPSGYTNVTIGLVWAWHALSPTPVMSEGVAYGTDNLTKFVILLTDGDNTRNRFSDSTNTMNNRTELACTNIKAAGIKIYTVRLIDGNASLLQGCATNASMYYDVQNAGELSGVFSAIGSEIASLHLSK
jgi:Flp pilus assembly protein TadG